jgi:hypothetical protein
LIIVRVVDKKVLKVTNKNNEIDSRNLEQHHVKGQLCEIKNIWDNANKAQEVDYVGNGEWITQLDNAMPLLDAAAADFWSTINELSNHGHVHPDLIKVVKKWFGEKP